MTESGQVTWLNSIVETSKMTEKWSGLQILKIELDQKLPIHVHWTGYTNLMRLAKNI